MTNIIYIEKRVYSDDSAGSKLRHFVVAVLKIHCSFEVLNVFRRYEISRNVKIFVFVIK